MTLDISLNRSYQHCSRIARRAASSFYWSFWLLPRDKRLAMVAMYAFSRRSDDIVDDHFVDNQPDQHFPAKPNQHSLVQIQQLTAWRRSIKNALKGQYEDPILPALADVVQRYHIPHEYLFDIIDGVEMDLEPQYYETFDELSKYCYRVASAVGLACIHIWGFDSNAAHEPAVKCGLAFQLTNILRDLKEDAQRGRIYLPLADLRKFDYSTQELLEGVQNDRFQALLCFEIQRAEQLYKEAAPLYECLHDDGRRVLSTMTSTYRCLLKKIKKSQGDVLRRRVSLDWGQKIAIVGANLFGHHRPSPSPSGTHD